MAVKKSLFGPGIPWTWYRSISGLRPEMGPKMAERWILALPEKWGKRGPENGKNGPKSIFEPFLGHFFHFPGHFSHFTGHFSPIFQMRPKSIFRPFSSPFRAGGPKRIYTRSTGFHFWSLLSLFAEKEEASFLSFFVSFESNK